MRMTNMHKNSYTTEIGNEAENPPDYVVQRQKLTPSSHKHRVCGILWFDDSKMPNITIENSQPYNKIGDGPEGPEVYVMTQQLLNRFPIGSKLISIKSLHHRYKIPSEYKNLIVNNVYSKGKKTIIIFNKDLSLLISYGMTGHWETCKSDYAQLEFVFEKQNNVDSYFWTSTRSLPTCSVQFLSKKELDVELNKLGLDIIMDNPSDEEILEAFRGTKKNICAFLMEQSKICGVGNYIKAVVLYRCGISPHRKVNELETSEKYEIWSVAKHLAYEAIHAQGMGMRDYKDEEGNVVGIDFDITPYGYEYDSFGHNVVTETIGGRTSWWVPAVQF